MTVNQSQAGALQQFVVRWEIEGPLNAETTADPLVSENGIVDQDAMDDDGVFVIVQGEQGNSAALGVIDPAALGARAASAHSFIQWIRVVPATLPFPASFFVRIEDVSGLVPLNSPVILDELSLGFGLVEPFYLSEMNFVPQGAALVLGGLPAPPPGLRHTVTVGFRVGGTTKEEAELVQASCCSDPEDASGAAVSRDLYSFSTTSIQIPDETDVYFGFSGGSPDAGVAVASAQTGTVNTLANLGIAAEKFGPVTGTITPAGVVLRSSVAIGFAEVFTERSVGGGAFVRTIQASPVVLPAGTLVAVPFPIATPAGPGDIIRVGFRNSTGGAVITDISAELVVNN